MLSTICYVSSAKAGFTFFDQEHLFDQTLRNNKTLEISGALIYFDGNFLQIMEGDNTKLLPLYNSIKRDHRHHNIIEIINKPIKEKIFNGFETGYTVINNLDRLYSLQEYLSLMKLADIKQTRLRLVSNIIKKFLSIEI